ncbi:dihydroxy-acid dehydratase [Nonomuraea ferruginea]
MSRASVPTPRPLSRSPWPPRWTHPACSAYGQVLLDILSGNATLSIRGDEAEEAWRVLTPVLSAWSKDLVPLQEYPAGSDGPPKQPGLVGQHGQSGDDRSLPGAFFSTTASPRRSSSRARPIIGIAQTGNDLVPCDRHHLALADRVKAGIRDSGGIPLEFPVHPLQETGNVRATPSSSCPM